jgi:hypothetical protein
MKKKLFILCAALVGFSLSQASSQSGNSGHRDPAAIQSDVKPASLKEYAESGLPFPEARSVRIQHKPAAQKSLGFYDNFTAFDNDHPGLLVQDFSASTIPDNTVEIFPHPLDAASNNAWFNPGDIMPGVQFLASNNHAGEEMAVLGIGFAGNSRKTIAPNYFADCFIIMFDPPVSAVWMDVAHFYSDGSCNIEIYDAGNNLLGSDVTPASNDGVFWGVGSDVPIARIEICSTGDWAQGISRIAFQAGEPPVAVPLARWGVLLGLILIGGSIMARRLF